MMVMLTLPFNELLTHIHIYIYTKLNDVLLSLLLLVVLLLLLLFFIDIKVYLKLTRHQQTFEW
jgi:hypothetical protein